MTLPAMTRRLLPVLGCALVLGACGGGDGDGPSTASGGTAKPAPTATGHKPRFVSQTLANKLQLGSRETGVLSRLGKPEAVLSDNGIRCFVYATDAGPDTWLRMCFKDGRMTGVGTIPGRKTAMTLDVPDIKGSGTLRKPNASRKHRKAKRAPKP